MRKYTSYIWGWISRDGNRSENGRVSTVKPEDIIGIWGSVSYDGLPVPIYCETYLAEHAPEGGTKNSWTRKPLAMLQKMNITQVYQMANADQKNILFECEMVDIPVATAPEKPKMMLQLRWKCKCGHDFYTPCSQLSHIVKRLLKKVFSKVLPKKVIECEACHNKTAIEAGEKETPIGG